MRRWQQIGIYGALLLAVACGPSNPLVGAWEPDPGKSDALAAAGSALSKAFGAPGGVEFQADKMIAGGKTRTVEYDVQESRVIVTTPDGEGTVYTVVDDNHVSVEVPGGTLVLRRVGSGPDAASQGAEPAAAGAGEGEDAAAH